MSLRTGPRLTLLFIAFGLALVLPRAALACSVPKGDFDLSGTKDLKIVGDTAKQNIIIELHQGGYLVKIDCDGNGNYTGAGDINASGSDEIESYYITGGGNDTITVLQTDNLVGASKNIVSIMAGSNNKLTFNSQGFNTSGQSNVVFDVRGGAGADIVILNFAGATIDNSLVALYGDLGSGGNAASVTGGGQITDSVLDVNVALGLGNTNGAYADGGGVVSNSTVNVHFVGGDVTTAGDTVTTTFSGRLEDNSRVLVSSILQGGNDKYFGHYDISSFGIDTTSSPGSAMAVYTDMGNGFDISKIDDLEAVGPATINGALLNFITMGQQPDATQFLWNGLTGTGILAYRADGGQANDKLNMTLSVDGGSSNQLWILNEGNTEVDISALVADILKVTVDAPGSVSYGALPGVVNDGGMQGDDVCDFAGTALHASINCEKGAR